MISRQVDGGLRILCDGAHVLAFRTELSSEPCAHVCIAAVHAHPSD